MKKYIFKKQNGFSLIETIIYIAIFSMFVGALMTFTLNINSSRLHSQIMLEVKGQGSDLMRILTKTITNSTAINYPGTGLSSGTISLNTPDSLKNPTIFSGSGEAVYITEGLNSAVALTNNKVKVTNLSFTNVSKINTPGVIQIRFTISNTASQNLPEQQYSIDFYGTASLR